MRSSSPKLRNAEKWKKTKGGRLILKQRLRHLYIDSLAVLLLAETPGHSGSRASKYNRAKKRNQHRHTQYEDRLGPCYH